MTATRPYEQLVDRVRALVPEAVPAGGSVLLVSRGDGRLLNVPGRRVGHFPQTPSGLYAGHHPADGADALRQLLRLRAAGAGYLVFPETSRWWLDYYDDLREWLVGHARVLADRTGTGIVFALDHAGTALADAAATVAPHVASLAAVLLSPGVPLVVIGPPGAGAAIADRPVTELTADSPWPTASGARYAVVVPPADPSLLPSTRRLICHRQVLDLYALDG
jgi:hypothetical protein